MSKRAYVGLGGNLGTPEETFRRALDAMGAFSEVRTVSRHYRSKPYGFADQPDFLNAAAQLVTDLEPLTLLRELRRVEDELGKKVVRENGPRLIDLDLLLHGDAVLDTPELTLPHPGLPDRDFVLLPLHDLAPDLRHPVTGQTVAEMLAALEVTHVAPDETQPTEKQLADRTP